MLSSGRYAAARFRKAEPQPGCYKKALIAVSYAAGSFIVGFCIWPAAAGNILAEISILPAHLTSASEVSSRIHKADRLSDLSFQERWSVFPTPSAVIGGDTNRREAPRAERRERNPFSCELAFSPLVTKGNFSTRCIASTETSQTET